jgi:hypothetical protein
MKMLNFFAEDFPEKRDGYLVKDGKEYKVWDCNGYHIALLKGLTPKIDRWGNIVYEKDGLESTIIMPMMPQWQWEKLDKRYDAIAGSFSLLVLIALPAYACVKFFEYLNLSLSSYKFEAVYTMLVYFLIWRYAKKFDKWQKSFVERKKQKALHKWRSKQPVYFNS